MFRPSTRCGTPAFGITLMGLVEYCIINSTVSSAAFGPTEQFRPMTSTAIASSSRVNVSGAVPPGR